jgi:hypothetical protein
MRRLEVKTLAVAFKTLGEQEVLIYKQDIYPDNREDRLRTTKDHVRRNLQRLLKILAARGETGCFHAAAEIILGDLA